MRAIPILAPALAATLVASGAAAEPWPDGAANRPDITPAFAQQTEAQAVVTSPAPTLGQVADGLDTPWAIDVLPGDAGYLVTERGGTLRHVARDGTLSAPIAGVPEVVAERQGGLLDLALAPDFAQSRALYLTFSAPEPGGQSATAAIRATLSPDLSSLGDVTEIFRQTPPASTPGHYGSRIVPLPDGTVAITTGDRMRHAARAQDPGTAYGAVIRMRPDGSAPPDNPFVGQSNALPTLYSYGHRNLQGAALDGDGRLWTLEHGPAGGDELNLIAPGGNYGWPVASYGVNYNGAEIGDGRSAHAPDFTPPRYYWDPVIAPGGMVVYNGAMFPEWRGDILAAGLIAQAVVRLDLQGDSVMAEERLAEGVGRVRDVAIDHDGAILFVTDEGAASRLMRLAR
ncbi:PQQ-dependent sugar dehydrogenase [Roseicyclus marinus]|uniref:PQQ-dependent sugar dehydrogenase n=1 Tax=Roseicyclus marinus TaxID=2161673 RepID=UPI00241095AD|nr:PQQ-dependent sugar dehydrogenase [Roseicyclus marinus]MDG3042889.1 PQQ-dependent sugar dehydrogenase [Roseicyclus marinus]